LIRGRQNDKWTYKGFVLLVVLSFALFLVVNYLIWTFFTKGLVMAEEQTRDLVRLSYLVKIAQERRTWSDLPKRHIEIGSFKGGRVDMVTVGDSFSVGAGGGKNNYYQDYIATFNDFVVLNIPPFSDKNRVGLLTPVNTLAILYNSGYLDRIKPRYVLLESAERYIPERFINNFDFKENMPLDKLITFISTRDLVKSDNKRDDHSFINTGNMKFIYNNIKDLFPVKRINNKIYKMVLKHDVFSGNYGDRLYYSFEENSYRHYFTKDSICKVNDNLNFIAGKLAEKNIKLVFMPIVDRSNLYYEFAVAPRKPSIFFEELRPLPKKYQLIDTKEILIQEVRRGEKDIYYIDDTHWSWKAPEKIFNSIRFK
jgi:hypothetical protein